MSEQASAIRRPLILYHNHCPDGFCAAWVAHRQFGGGADYIPVQYGQPPPDVAGRDVFIVDFSYKRAVLLEMAEKANSVVVLDHHRTAEEDLRPLCRELDGVRRVPLSNGEFAYVDVEDLKKVSVYSWSRAVRGGAIAYSGGGRENAKMVYMHRLVMEAPEGLLVDHKNRNTLDNRKLNLRFATKKQNAANMDRGRVFKGVTGHDGAWQAQITVDGNNRYLGTFSSPQEAAAAYDTAAKEQFGEFARCNFGERDELFPANCEIRFDMGKSGARLAWEYFFPGEVAPWLVDYTEDRDLWRWQLEESREVNACLASWPWTFEEWDRLAYDSTAVAHFAVEGTAILRYQQQQITSICAHAREVELDGHKILAVNTSTLFSEVAGKLAEGRPFGAAWFFRGDGKAQWSLRSREGGIDVSEIAKRRGGGGHFAAAGFEETP